MLTREQILAARDRTRRLVTVPEWGGDLYLYSITARDKDALEARVMAAQRDGNMFAASEGLRVLLLSMSIGDEDGKRLFTEADLDGLSQRDFQVIERLYDQATELSGLTVAAKEAEAKK